MNTEQFDMRSLLEQAGFRLRGATRANCIHCTGDSLGTVSFTSEVAFCHRCKWKANALTMARELGLLSTNPRARKALHLERERRQRFETRIRAFEQWRDAELWRAIDLHRKLSRRAVLAEQVLRIDPEYGEAWSALADFYHGRAALTSNIERFGCSKVPEFLEGTCDIAQLYAEWKALDNAA